MVRFTKNPIRYWLKLMRDHALKGERDFSTGDRLLVTHATLEVIEDYYRRNNGYPLPDFSIQFRIYDKVKVFGIRMPDLEDEIKTIRYNNELIVFGEHVAYQNFKYPKTSLL
jgi:hypothetical protein